MRGSKREVKPGVWELRVTLGRDAKGRQRQRSVTHHGGARSADKALRALVTEVEASGQEQPHMLVSTLVDEYVARRSARWAPKTTYDIRGLVKRLSTSDLWAQQLDAVTPAGIERFTAAVGVERGARTARAAHVLLSGSFRLAYRLGWVAANPMLRVEPPPTAARRDPTAHTVADLSAAIDVAQSPAWVQRRPGLDAFIRVALATGARRGELVGLKWADVDLDEGVVTFSRAMTAPGGARMTMKGLKRGTVRVVPVGAATIEALEEWRGKGSPVWVFGDPDQDLPWHVDRVSRWWRSVADEAGLAGVRLHDVRHATVTSLVASGADPRVVADHVGHDSPVMTLDLYAGAVPARRRAAADVLDAEIGADAEDDDDA